MLTDCGVQSERYYSLVNGRPNISKYVDVLTNAGAGQVRSNQLIERNLLLGGEWSITDRRQIHILESCSRLWLSRHEGDVWDDERGVRICVY